MFEIGHVTHALFVTIFVAVLSVTSSIGSLDDNKVLHKIGILGVTASDIRRIGNGSPWSIYDQYFRVLSMLSGFQFADSDDVYKRDIQV
ncbi:hypothetical protein ACTXT7_006148 [Hymenolepis weldensis]